MKLSIAIADTNALPSAFVVYRGFEECIPKAAELGFNGVELALKRVGEIDIKVLERLLSENNIQVSCISTGQVYSDGGLMLTHCDFHRRSETINVLKDFIGFAADFGGIVNLGRVRGQKGVRTYEETLRIFSESVEELSEYALKKNVTLVIEPVNRYEIDFINSIEEGVKLINEINKPNLLLMPDIFHMNIEDRRIGGELAKHIDKIKYIHLADSNRLSPGQGHINFREIFDHLFAAHYNGWVSVEILPSPSPDVAARQAAEFLIPFIQEFNKKMLNATAHHHS